jgi:hypothetical protein
MGDIDVTQSIDLIVSSDTLVSLVILVKVIGGQYKEVVSGCADILYIMIGKMVLPGADLRESDSGNGNARIVYSE